MRRLVVSDRAEADLREIWLYTFTDDEVLVIRVLHGSMDPDLHLDDDDQ